jgi:serine/threonine protein kinase
MAKRLRHRLALWRSLDRLSVLLSFSAPLLLCSLLNLRVQVMKNSLALARAMHHLHCTAIDGYILMHRDLKPDNIAFSVHKVRTCSRVGTGVRSCVGTSVHT